MGWSLFRPTGLTHRDSRSVGGYTLITPIGGDMTCLLDEEGHIVAQESIWIVSVVCHLELVALEGHQVTVEYWGRFGIEYSISWGDQFADHVMVSTQSGGGIASHTYAAPGTYSLGMEEIWAPSQIFFSITVE